MFYKKQPLDFYYILAKLWKIFIKNYPVYTLELKMYSLLLLKLLHIHWIFFANNYLISSLNRIENTAQYSINNQAGVLH